jgi:hypothetical protein
MQDLLCKRVIYNSTRELYRITLHMTCFLSFFRRGRARVSDSAFGIEATDRFVIVDKAWPILTRMLPTRTGGAAERVDILRIGNPLEVSSLVSSFACAVPTYIFSALSLATRIETY